MNVLLLSLGLLLTLVLKHSGDVYGQLTVPSSPTCPGVAFTLSCTVTTMSGMNAIILWRVNGTNDLCTLTQLQTNTDTCGPNSAFTASPGRANATSFSSTLKATAIPELEGMLVECFGPEISINLNNRVGESPIRIVGPPSAPILSCVDLSEDVSGAVNVTVSWTLSGGDSADFYLISITTNAPQTPYGGLLNITTASVTQYELTGFLSGYEYNITVHGVNCGGLVGRESEPLTIRPQVPEVSVNCSLTLSYNQSPGRLLSILSTWTSVPNPVDPDPGEICPGPSGNVIQYQINFQTGFIINHAFIVRTTMCKARRCNYTFEPPPNPPSSYDSVSVAAENVVGVGAARTCTTQTINTTNNLLTGDVVDVSLPDNVKINCTFQSGFRGSAHCAVQYGTDPTYMNLPYSAESTETGTVGDSVSVVLRERLNSSTVYYYTVSAISGDVTAVVRGTFTTPLYNCSLMELWNLSAADATFLSDVSLLGDDAAQYPSCDDGSVGSAVLRDDRLSTATVAYYTGTTPGSRACFVCDESSGYGLNTTTTAVRVCRNDVTWSGSPIICEFSSIGTASAGAIAGGVVPGLVVVVAIVAI